MDTLYPDRTTTKMCREVRRCVKNRCVNFTDLCDTMYNLILLDHVVPDARIARREECDRFDTVCMYQRQNYVTNIWRIVHDQRNRTWRY